MTPEKQYEINVDPRILELLGPNLYTNVYYVLAELIANAYDADARNVYIFSEDEFLRVEDDGRGMSYEAGDVRRYLNVAGVSRTTEKDSYTPAGRRKMGRKGVGKLAALSVSENVDVLTVAGGERSGFVLTRHPDNGNVLEAIPDAEVRFLRIGDHGSAIVMHKPQYQLHKTMSAVRRNLLKMFPLVGQDFRIHVIRGKESVAIDSFDQSVMSELSTLITLGADYGRLAKLVPNPYPARRDDLISIREAVQLPIQVVDASGAERELTLEIQGWIGTYKSTRGRKVEMTDFPDNFISLFANGKLGEFNILPAVGQNKLSEVYVVGQLHVDMFELTELPDMALSNRQGYKSDDPRYLATLGYVRNRLLGDARRSRDLFVSLENKMKKERKRSEQLDNEARFKASIDEFRRKASESAAEALHSLAAGASEEEMQKVVAGSFNRHIPELGIKALVDSQKKKILISQTRPDKPFADVIQQMLSHNGVSNEDILYTNGDDEVCRIPEGRKVYEYLREFFVDSYSTQKIMVLFVTSENTKSSWGAISEVGASWITQVDHKIFNISPFRPEHPLNDEAQWQSTSRDLKTGDLWMDKLNADILCQKIESVCDSLGYSKRLRPDNLAYLGTLVDIRSL
ncbi:ATP-binding protein [Rathayibacter caricis DSM 15933]|uniref:ATP-binding protein n=1 Tax=Rathayibacter caricis DSM 15933 TaxID=1328867 RepID=A0A2T4UUL6_9MICO|nr:ATP-binding protein [Rathayibacter caricis]PTL73229.1 ATP-binding protein [Rathayibacter caricis DSM 15933]